MSKAGRVNHQTVFLLSAKPWRENSLWVEVFSREYGRLALLARSARTRGSELRGVLVPFVPLSASWFGKEELKTLHRAEWIGGWALPKNRFLFSALYVNELVLKLTAREDPHPEIFDALSTILRIIAEQQNHIAALRCFEWTLLNALGLLPDMAQDDAGAAVAADVYYLLRPQHLLQRVPEPEAAFAVRHQAVSVRGSVLQALQQGNLAQDDLPAAAALTRMLIDFYLPEGIGSRTVLQQLNSLKQRVGG